MIGSRVFYFPYYTILLGHGYLWSSLANKKVVEGKTLHGMCVTKSSHTQLDLSLERFDMICR